MTYAAINDRVLAGLALSAAFATGMVATVAVFPMTAVLLRHRTLGWSERTTVFAGRARFLLEMLAAAAVIGLGLYPLLLR
jgi:ABC-type nickel/cobalt efflux system permease component RcnA